MEKLWMFCMILVFSPFAMGTDEDDLAMHNREFAISMYKELAKQTDGNIIFSPFSISMAMGMVFLGAKNKTAAEMAEVLKFPNNDKVHETFKKLKNNLSGSDDVELGIANKPYARNEFEILQEYLNSVSQNYGGELERLDFLGDPEGSRQTINGWVEEKTKQKIEKLLPPGFITPDTAMVLVNAIYFKGMWKHAFNKSLTSKETFHQTTDKEIELDMMKMRDEQFALTYSEDLKSNVISLPYKGETFEMVILLPDAADGLSQVESDLDLDKLDAALLRLRHKNNVGLLRIPKFKLLQEANLVERFESLGIHELFSDDADLTGINGKGLLSVSDIAHKAFIDVNEEGTEAAAGTGVKITLMSAGMNFIADHPFLFLIRHKATNSILFLGRFKEAPAEKGDTIGVFMRHSGGDPVSSLPGLIMCSMVLVFFFFQNIFTTM